MSRPSTSEHKGEPTSTQGVGSTPESSTFFRELFPLIAGATIGGASFYDHLGQATHQDPKALSVRISQQVARHQDGQGIPFDQDLHELLSQPQFAAFFNVHISADQKTMQLVPTDLARLVVNNIHTDQQPDFNPQHFQVFIDHNAKIAFDEIMRPTVVAGRYKVTAFATVENKTSPWMKFPLTEPRGGFETLCNNLFPAHGQRQAAQLSTFKRSQPRAKTSATGGFRQPVRVNLGCGSAGKTSRHRSASRHSNPANPIKGLLKWLSRDRNINPHAVKLRSAAGSGYRDRAHTTSEFRGRNGGF